MTEALLITPLTLSKVCVTPHTQKMRSDDPSLKNNYLQLCYIAFAFKYK